MEIRRSHDRHISTMGFPILVRRHLILNRGPGPIFYLLSWVKPLNKSLDLVFEPNQVSYGVSCLSFLHDDVIKWKHIPSYRPWQGFPWLPVSSPHKGQWHRALMFSLNCTLIKGWVSNREAGDLICHHAHYDVIVMLSDFTTHLDPRWYCQSLRPRT